MQSDNTDNVWIDRAEYERLKALAEQNQQVAVTTPDSTTIYRNPIDAAASPSPSPQTPWTASYGPNESIIASYREGALAEDNENSLMSPTTVALAMSALVSFVFPPALLLFLGLGVHSLSKLFRRSSGKTKTGIGIALGAASIVLMAVFGPFITLFAFVILWQIGCWTGLGSCTTA